MHPMHPCCLPKCWEIKLRTHSNLNHDIKIINNNSHKSFGPSQLAEWALCARNSLTVTFFIKPCRFIFTNSKKVS